VGTDDQFADVLNGFSLTARRPQRAAAAPTPTPFPKPVAAPDEPIAEEAASFVRAYAWTGGRTQSAYQLEIETLIATSARGLDAAMSLEHQDVVELCRESKSVAEVAALLRLPLGVARVLLGDMARLGLITVFEHDTSPDMELLERVLRGLTNLRT
jgi:hypothetical protein